MSDDNLNENFKRWACSLSGCDGGNPKAKMWISGIEWGIGEYPYEKYYLEELPKEIEKGEYVPADKYPWNDTLEPKKGQYGKNVAKLVSAINGKKVEDYNSFVENTDGSELFKLNLYPIAFKNTSDSSWKEYKLDELTGFPEKHLFRTWCFFNRFPVFAQKVINNEPKVIIGTGISYLTDFFACFHGLKEMKSKINANHIVSSYSTNDSPRYYYWSKITNETTLFVIPFLGKPSGLNSNELIQKMGDKIKEITNFN